MSYRIRTDWMGSEIETLADLLKPDLKAVCVGINPAPISVRADHYYQGKLGQRVLSRLETAHVIPPGGGGWADEWAFSHSVCILDQPLVHGLAAHPVAASHIGHRGAVVKHLAHSLITLLH